MSPPPTTTALSFLLLITLSLTTVTATPTAPTAYDIVQSYGFPVGILPKGVTGYELDEKTGKFKLFLSETCKFSIEGYDLEYKSTITGIISPNRIYQLKGISVRILIIWLGITEVTKKDGDLHFSVGISSANFPLDGFYESPTCGCGFDCVDANEVPNKSLVSSS